MSNRNTRSGSRDSERRRDHEVDKLQSQVDNLAAMVKTLTKNIQLVQTNGVTVEKTVAKNSEHELDIDAEKDKQDSVVERNSPAQSSEKTPESQAEQVSAKDSVRKILGMERTGNYKEIKYVSELNNTWSKWMIQGLPEKNKKDILEAYNRKGDFYTEAPKVNLELGPILTDIAKKRDQHFTDTQNCVGTALSALGAAVSLLLEPAEEGLDEDLLTNYISHAGQMLSDIFYQQSVARKSFITPQLNKNMKAVVGTMLSKEWLYGDNLSDQIKDMKKIEEAYAGIKEKPPTNVTAKPRDQRNVRYPPANDRHVGYQQKRRMINFRPKPYTSTQRPSQPVFRATRQPSWRR